MEPTRETPGGLYDRGRTAASLLLRDGSGEALEAVCRVLEQTEVQKRAEPLNVLREQLPGKAHPEKVGTVARCKGVLCSSASERARIAAGLVALGERRYEAWAARAVALSEDGQFTFSTRATCSASSLALDSLRAKDYPDNLLPWIRKAHAMDAESVKLTTLAALR